MPRNHLPWMQTSPRRISDGFRHRKSNSSAVRPLSLNGRYHLLRLILCSLIFIAVLPTPSHAQFKDDDIPGFAGLQSGSQAPPGIYIGSLAWVYPTDTIKDNNGNSIALHLCTPPAPVKPVSTCKTDAAGPNGSARDTSRSRTILN